MSGCLFVWTLGLTIRYGNSGAVKDLLCHRRLVDSVRDQAGPLSPSHSAAGGCPCERGERLGAFGSPRAAATSSEPHRAGALPLR